MKQTKRRTRLASIIKSIRKRNHYHKYHVSKAWPRKLARSVAKHNMERAGMKHINNMFAWQWRRYVKAR